MNAKERAVYLARNWYAGGNLENTEDDLRRTAGLAKVIEKALIEQDKLTRQAIAEALEKEADRNYSEDEFSRLIVPEEAERIVMTTRAL